MSAPRYWFEAPTSASDAAVCAIDRLFVRADMALGGY